MRPDGPLNQVLGAVVVPAVIALAVRLDRLRR
jgi:hypothetical protein